MLAPIWKEDSIHVEGKGEMRLSDSRMCSLDNLAVHFSKRGLSRQPKNQGLTHIIDKVMEKVLVRSVANCRMKVEEIMAMAESLSSE